MVIGQADQADQDRLDGRAQTMPAAISGDEAFAAVYHAYHSLVYRTCLGVLRDPAEAEDATQETFLRAYRERSTMPAKPAAWLRVVARNHSLDLRRGRVRREHAAAGLRTIDGPGPDPGSRAVDRTVLMEAIDGLAPREREVLWGSAVEDRSLSSMAESMGLSYMGAAQLLHRARRRARRLLTEAMALLLPLVPPRLRERPLPGWLQAPQAAVGLPEAATAAAVLAVLVAGPWLNPDQPPRPVPPPPAAAGAPGAVADGGGGSAAAGVQAAAPGAGSAAARTQAPGGGATTSGPAAGGAAPGQSLPAGGVIPPAGTVVPPVTITLPGLITVNATGPAGAVVQFSVSAGGGSGALKIDCSTASGSQFPIGTTSVACTAKDGAGHSATGSFDVAVVAAPPVSLKLPGDISLASLTGQPVRVTFQASAEGGYGQVEVACTPASGSLFPGGTTTVSCTATDAYGQTGRGSLHVLVTSAPALIGGVVAEIQGWQLNPGISTSLLAKLNAASASLVAGNTGAACGQMGAFASEAAAQSGLGLTSAQSAQLLSDAARIRSLIGC